MKTKSLLFLIIIGMLLIDISCNWGGEGESREEITGINGIHLYKKGKWYSSINVNNTNDTFAYDSLLFGVDFKTTRIAFNSGFLFINGAYSDEIPTIIIMNFDSLKIFSINNGDKTDVTNQFFVSNNFGSPQSKIDNSDPGFIQKFLVNGSGGNLYFQLNTPPLKTDTFQFNFQFFDKKGRIFEKMSDPVVITP